MLCGSVQIAVASRVLLGPALQLCPTAALPMLSYAALRFVIVGRPAGDVVGVTHDVHAELVETMCDVGDIVGLRRARIPLDDG